jgi:MerR family transcriptional regulator, thiopeptide resistance regulator
VGRRTRAHLPRRDDIDPPDAPFDAASAAGVAGRKRCVGYAGYAGYARYARLTLSLRHGSGWLTTMAKSEGQTYRVSEFARLAGVTVRALRHYDRLGLLTPRRTDGGYRVYTTRDLETLEQIVALKFIGVPLRDVAIVRRGTTEALARALGAQRRTLEAKQRLLARAIDAIGEAEAALRTGHPVHAGLTKIIEVITMQNDEARWLETYKELVERKRTHLLAIPKEQREGLRQQWAELKLEIARCLDEDPSGPKGQEFARRWLDLMKQTSGVDDKRLAAHFATRPKEIDMERIANEFNVAATDLARIKAALAPSDPRIWEFVRRAMAAHNLLPEDGRT